MKPQASGSNTLLLILFFFLSLVEFPDRIINFGSKCLLLRRKWSKNWTWSRISQQQQNGASGVPNTHISSFSHEFKHRVCSATTKSYNWSQYNIWNSNRPFKNLRMVLLYLKNQLIHYITFASCFPNPTFEIRFIFWKIHLFFVTKWFENRNWGPDLKE